MHHFNDFHSDVGKIPQVWMNCRNESVIGVSSPFVTLIVIGDLSSLIGLIIEGGLATQMITAAWFTLCNSICWFQIIYSHSVKAKCCPANPVVPGFPMLIVARSSAGESPYRPPFLWGTILGWVSAIGYLSSRFPGLRENCRRKKTKRLRTNDFLSASIVDSLLETVSVPPRVARRSDPGLRDDVPVREIPKQSKQIRGGENGGPRIWGNNE
jgi:hypothetical protein